MLFICFMQLAAVLCEPTKCPQPLIMKLAEIGQQLSDPTVTDAMIRTAVVDCAQTFKDVEESFGTQDAEPQPDYHNMTFTMKLERIWGQQYHIIPLCLTASTD